MQYQIEEVKTSRQLREFTGLPRKLYRNNPNWIPRLRISVRGLFNRGKHPFYEHADVALFLARNDLGLVTGRIAAIINHMHNEYHSEKTGFFGFLEGERDQIIFKELLGKAEHWVCSRGMESIRGPFNFSTNEDCGLLVKGFEYDPLIMMPYNPEWYAEMIESAGYCRLEDLLAYWADSDIHNLERISRIADLVRRKANINLRNFRMNDYCNEVATVMDIYNECWRDNWGFVPMTRREFDHMGKELRMILKSEFSPIIEIEGKPVAFAIALPDVNKAIKAGKGRLIGTLLAMKVPPFKTRIDRVRVLLLGVRRAYRGRGLEAVLIDHIVRESGLRGMGRGELSWILEDNMPMREILEKDMKADQYKTYRIFQKDLRKTDKHRVIQPDKQEQ